MRKLKLNKWEGYLFISPFLFGLFVFYLYPLGMSAYLSLTQWDMMTPPKYVGIANYVQLLTKDDIFYKSLINTLFFALVSVSLRIVLSLGLALLLNMKMRGSNVFRSIFYVPAIVNQVAMALVWIWVFDPTFGIVNNLLRELFGIEGPRWLGDPQWAMPTIIIMNLVYCGPTMVIFLAGLQDIPAQLYEAAALDGAGTWSCFRNVTLPMLTPTLFYNIIMGIINSFQLFTDVYVTTRGGPANATMVYVLYMYFQSFRWLNMGYASAMSWIFFLISLVLTIILLRTSRKWVHY